MSNVDKILNVARAWIGCKESDGSHKQIIDVYNSYTPHPRGYTVKYTDSWCMTYVSAVFIKVGLSSLCPIECSCKQAIDLAKQMGIWEENDDITPTPGMIIMYDWDKKDGNPEHVGIVENVSGKQITVIEGNKSDSVSRRVINVGDATIRGYVLIKCDGTSSTPSQPSTPVQNTGVNYKVKVNTPSGVNCRKEPSTSGAKITAYPNGQVLTITAESNGWLYANNIGWVYGQYCVKVSSASSSSSNGRPTGTYQVSVGTALIVRSGPGSNYARKSKSQLTEDGQAHSNANGGLLNGTRVTVYEWQNGYARIPSGWVCGDYLVKV